MNLTIEDDSTSPLSATQRAAIVSRFYHWPQETVISPDKSGGFAVLIQGLSPRELFALAEAIKWPL